MIFGAADSRDNSAGRFNDLLRSFRKSEAGIILDDLSSVLMLKISFTFRASLAPNPFLPAIVGPELIEAKRSLFLFLIGAALTFFFSESIPLISASKDRFDLLALSTVGMSFFITFGLSTVLGLGLLSFFLDKASSFNLCTVSLILSFSVEFNPFLISVSLKGFGSLFSFSFFSLSFSFLLRSSLSFLLLS